MVFIASTMNSVSPSFTCWPTFTKGGLPGSAAAKTVPTMGEGTAPATGPLTGLARERRRQKALLPLGAHRRRATPDARAIMLDLDFGKAGLLQQRRQFAHRVGVDSRFGLFVLVVAAHAFCP